MIVEEHIPLGPLTTFKIGGPARFFVRVTQIDELRKSLDFARDKALKVFILGGGANVLFDDSGFGGLIIKIEITGIEEEGNTFRIGAGESWDAFVESVVQKGFWGVENLSGIPGSVGGAVVQNVGAYGQVLSQTLAWVEAFDTERGEVQRLDAPACAFGYRSSAFKTQEGRYIVLRAAFTLSAQPHPNVSYKDLATRFTKRAPGLQEIREAVIDIRGEKFPDLAIEGTAGSFFKNPVLPKAEAEKLQAKYPTLPLFSLPESSDVKVPLGWFLDYRHGVLDMRTVRVGGARMYEKQFLVVVVEGHTSSQDVKKLAATVQKEIYRVLSLNIEPEVRII